jgi:cysteine desulfurase
MNDVREVYMDYNATAPVRREAVEAYRHVLAEGYGNPSSAHFAGRRAKAALDESRERIAATMGARPAEIFFTGGGTEGDNLAIKGIAAMHGQGHIVTSSIEHPAVLSTCRSLDPCDFDVTYLPVGADGRVDPEAVRGAVRKDTILITVMWVNNETGVIQPIEAIGAIAREKSVTFHSDAVQAYGRLLVNVGKLPVDALTISGHKFCAPKGTGALYVRRGVQVETVVHGGGQERRMRSGTENVAGVAAMAEAAELACAERESETGRLGALRDRLESGVQKVIPNATVNGGNSSRVANTSNISFAGAHGETVLTSLDEKRVAVSSASACMASAEDPSHVLRAMGLSRKQADESLRFSLGRFSDAADVERCLEVLPGIVERIRSIHTP